MAALSFLDTAWPGHQSRAAVTERIGVARRGRPSAYNASRGDELIAIMRQGHSVAAAAGAMGVHRDTIYEWARKRAEFSDILRYAKALRLLKLERDLLTGSESVTIRRSIVLLQNADREEWGNASAARHSATPLAQLYAQLAGTALRPKVSSSGQ